MDPGEGITISYHWSEISMMCPIQQLAFLLLQTTIHSKIYYLPQNNKNKYFAYWLAWRSAVC